MLWLIAILVLIGLLVAFCWFYHHQRLLRDRAFLMNEAIRNRDFTFQLPVKGLFFGEGALQSVLNDLGQEINRLVAQNEVESWQRLTRVLTHEIMNATAPIQSITQTYLNQPQIKNTVYEEGIRAIHDTSKGLATFVESYRKLTQLQEAHPTDLKLAGLVSSVQTLYSELQWKTSLPADLTLCADESLLRQVLVNIVRNAAEAGATVIDIRWRDRLYISNNGKPIPAELRQEIFVPFFTTKTTGSGIGLALSRQMMMIQGMTLTLATVPVGGYPVTFIIE